MNDAIHLKYLAVSPDDLRWGIAVNSVGFQDVGPGEPYPPSDHPSRYLFSAERGRTLAEYQLLYITRGHGRFRSAHVPDGVLLRPGHLFLLFPANGTPTGPTRPPAGRNSGSASTAPWWRNG